MFDRNFSRLTVNWTTHLFETKYSTGGQAFPQCVFDHWQVMNYDPLAVHPQDMKDPAKVKQFYDNNQAYKIMMKIRKRRGLKEEQPKLDDYIDRMWCGVGG